MSAFRKNGKPFFLITHPLSEHERTTGIKTPPPTALEAFEAEELQGWEEDPDAAIDYLQDQMELVLAQIDEACEMQEAMFSPTPR